ncbi:MAG: hypothetical protein MUD03_05150 [Pirellula sp.]|nr:hypothetical protein [Pirellula sp.]
MSPKRTGKIVKLAKLERDYRMGRLGLATDRRIMPLLWNNRNYRYPAVSALLASLWL